MSYANMNHAGWVEANNAAGRTINAKRKAKADRFGRKVGYHASPEKLSPFQARVMDIPGMVFGSIYNAPITWETVDWGHGRSLSVMIGTRQTLATFDYDHLTKFVFLCHVARIRGVIEATAPHCYRLTFSQRQIAGDMSERHPDLHGAVVAFEEYLPADHRVRYR